MNTDQQTSGEDIQPPHTSLNYAEFSLLLAQYKRAVFESLYQADDPIEGLLKL